MTNQVYSERLKHYNITQVERSLLKDMQDFIVIALGTVRYFYRRCTSIDTASLVEALIETITYILFEANDAAIYNLLLMLYKMQNHKLQQKMDD